MCNRALTKPGLHHPQDLISEPRKSERDIWCCLPWDAENNAQTNSNQAERAQIPKSLWVTPYHNSNYNCRSQSCVIKLMKYQMSLNESSSGGTSSTSKLLVTAVTHFEDGVTLLIRLNTHHLAPWPAMARSWGRIQELQKLSGSSRIFAPWKMSTSICIIVYIYIYCRCWRLLCI